jgi:hypothetical protein
VCVNRAFRRRGTVLGIVLVKNAAGGEIPCRSALTGLAGECHGDCRTSKFAGRYGEEATLLALAAELETAQPWFDRVPAP